MDSLIKLSLRPKTRRWTEAPAQIVNAVAAANHLTPGTVDVAEPAGELPGGGAEPAEPPLEQQVEETDLAFLHRLAREYDCKVFVDHTEANDTLNFVATSKLLAEDPLERALVFNASMQSFAPSFDLFAADPEERLVTTDPSTAERVQLEPEADRRHGRPVVPRPGPDRPARRRRRAGGHPCRPRGAPALSRHRQLAPAAPARRSTVPPVVGTGRDPRRPVTPPRPDRPRPDAGKHLAAAPQASEDRRLRGPLVGRLVPGPHPPPARSPPAQFHHLLRLHEVAMPLAYRHQAAAPVFPGVYVASVEGVEGDDDDRLGRIQVSVPAVFGEVSPEYFAWARPCFPYGHFFVPEKGERVWVAFENGDPTAPVWLGVLYPKGKVPAEADASPPAKRVVKTASGHVVVLDDTSGSESVEIRAGKHNHKIRLDDKGITIESSSKEVLLTNGSVKIKLSGSAVEVS